MIVWDAPPINESDISIQGVTEWTHGWDEDLEVEILREQNQKLLDLARFYAKIEVWGGNWPEAVSIDPCDWEEFDQGVKNIRGGKRAREVLNELGIS